MVSADSSGDERLSSWKEIAVYLHTSVRTVERWERLESLPVHRHEHSKSGRVYALKSELDSWTLDRRARRVRERVTHAPAWVLVAVWAATLAAVAGGVALWFTRPWVPKGAPRLVHLTTVPGLKLAPSFSPDGTQVAFAWNGGTEQWTDIYVKSIGPGEPRRLTTLGGVVPAWSPDGRWIAYARREAGQVTAIMAIPPTGGSERTIARARNILGGDGLALAWSPDSRWLAVPDCAEANGPAALVKVYLENGTKRQLTFPPVQGPGDGSPAWSPDGRTLAFARYRDIRVSDLHVQTLTEAYEPRGEPLCLTDDHQWKDQVVWSSDGRALIYVSRTEFGRSLWRLSVPESAKPQLLTFVEPPASYPAVSRQGNRLAFAHVRSRNHLERLELSGRVNMPTSASMFAPSGLDEDSPAFSPGGDRVAFVSNRSGTEEVWVSRSDGTGAFQLTSMGNAIWPQWSPDGSTITFASNKPGEAQIYAVPSIGGQARRLFSSQFHECMPNWSHDAKWIYFASNREDGFQIWKMAATGGNPLRVTRHGGCAAKETPDGKLLYYTKEHRTATSLWRMPANGGPEVQIVNSVWAEGFAPTRHGVYFLTPLTNDKLYAIEFLDSVRDFPVRLKTLTSPAVRGLSLSPDGSALIYAALVGSSSDLMLAEGFR